MPRESFSRKTRDDSAAADGGRARPTAAPDGITRLQPATLSKRMIPKLRLIREEVLFRRD
jgi:hypothetical protein